MFASSKLAISYAIFALIATAANIGAQDLVIRAYSGAFDILASVVVGTGVGLVVKYILDKRYIFRFRARSVAHDTQTFAECSKRQGNRQNASIFRPRSHLVKTDGQLPLA